ncbi:MAG: 50S ribosomal protein L22 [Candidatus Micrarchaeota archaeon]
MGLFKYSVQEKEGEKWGKAQLHDVNCSYKDLSQVFSAIKGLRLRFAEEVLNDAISMKKAIPYHKFATKIGHRSELGGKKGRYPKKECKIALQMIENAKANAVKNGLDETMLFVKHAASYKQNVLRRYRRIFGSSRTLGYGKQSLWSNFVTCWAELVVAEVKSEKSGKEKAKATPVEQKKEAKEPKAEQSKAGVKKEVV